MILEDNAERQRAFVTRLIDADYKIVSTVRETIYELNNHRWDYLFLDHDLGEGEGKGTGHDVALWLTMHPDKQPKNIVLHTMNPVGAANIKKLLTHAVVAPGCWKHIGLTVNDET